MSFNPLYLLLIIPMLLTWWSQSKVRQTYEEYGERPNRLGLSGTEAATRLLAHLGLSSLRIERISGYLTDHYDPRKKTLRLSDGVARGSSITSLGIVAHEVGHAAQDAQRYRFMRLRTALSRRIGQVTGWSSIAFVGGWIFGVPLLMAFSAAMMAGMVVFSLVTLPVERNASDRALKSLEETGMAAPEEIGGVRKVLRAAAFTYLTGLGQRLGRLMFFVLLAVMGMGFF